MKVSNPPSLAEDNSPSSAAGANGMSSSGKPSFPVVALGASAGGLAAFESFISAMPQPPSPAIALILVQHLAPSYKSILAELVQRHTSMRVYEVTDGMFIEPNCIYIIPPNRYMALVDGSLTLTEPTAPRGLRLPIDFFFRSLAATRREAAICVVLSGTGSDGTLGGRAIKAEGGMVMAQHPETAEYDSMPLSAINTGLVDYVLAPSEMPTQLLAYVQHAMRSSEQVGTAISDSEFLRKICALLHLRTGHDFSNYKETTLTRRLSRRMALHQIEKPRDYLDYQRDNPPEIEALFRDLLIGVTNFFRDPQAFESLAKNVLAPLVRRSSANDPLRIWVCGCSTGEEAYSIAMLLHECGEAGKTRRVQIFATDIDHNAIEFARAGIYPANIATDVSEDRLRRYFLHDSATGKYRIQKLIRDMVVFSEQDVVRDPPFSKLHLITCRNLLIYLNADVQRKLIPLFHYALLPGGALFLGPSESVGDAVPHFNNPDRKWKIYTRRSPIGDAEKLVLPHFMPPLYERGLTKLHGKVESGTDEGKSDCRRLIEQALLMHYVQAALLVDARGEVLHIIGRTGLFLEPAAGDARMNILMMAREGLRRELTVALHKVVAHKQPVSYQGLRVKTNGDDVSMNLIVRPALPGPASNSDIYVVILETWPGSDATPANQESPIAESISTNRVAELEQELRTKEEYLQTTLEEMETTNEELKSTNEEMQSVNEELQSTNEELETSKEELQSVNEELSTVNAELQNKLSDLSRANNDMNNLLAGTGIGTVFLDHQLHITRFTPAATQVINLIPSDIGRPLAHVVSNLVNYDRLAQDVRTVIDTLTPIEQEVEAHNGDWYLMRIRPYRTMENVIAGAVLTLVDISLRGEAERSLKQSQARFQGIVNQARVGIAETDLDGRFSLANDMLCELLGYSAEELMQLRLVEFLDVDDRRRMSVQLQGLLDSSRPFALDVAFVAKDGQRVRMHAHVNAIPNDRNVLHSLVFILADQSARKHIEHELSAIDICRSMDAQAISLLQTLSELYVSAATLSAVSGDILVAAATILDADMTMLHLVAPNGDLRYVAERNVPPIILDAWLKALNEKGVAETIFANATPMIAENLTQDVPITGALPSARFTSLQAAIVAPICSRKGLPLGILSVGYCAPQSMSERSSKYLELLIRHVATCIDQATPDYLRTYLQEVPDHE